ncbi:hypothetical protein WKK05_09430 [Nostoc sp. UHCC 0302]|uniref:hypothetical protein n=1 Tax=Nostoc sp. UHCC 0302 TaxID=3134896 RepID=UPI00311CB095
MQAGNFLYETLREHKGHAILTKLTTVPGDRRVFYFDVHSQQVVITFLYSAPDGSIWASYYPLIKDLWQRGCCRIEHLKKLPGNPSSVYCSYSRAQ